ncbi:MAG: FKBP-type peptidyl-prolyl cis-trans isomerase [Planctomycetaceae bacterium]
MRRRTAALLAVASLLLIPEFTVAQAPDAPFPTLPAGAGQIDADAPQAFATTASGLQYRVLRKGAGGAPKATSTVKVNYHGWFDDGKTFDSSYDRREPIEFPLNGVIPGWTEGMQLVQPGGMIELVIPGKLGYGPRGMPGAIPPNATLHFLVELLEVR